MGAVVGRRHLDATFVPESAAELDVTYELRLGDERLTVRVGEGTIAISRAARVEPTRSSSTGRDTLRAVAFGDRALAGALLEIKGDARLVVRECD